MSNVCKCEGKCFARGEIAGKCTILTEAYEKDCPFQKADRHYTKGVYFPDNTKKGANDEV